MTNMTNFTNLTNDHQWSLMSINRHYLICRNFCGYVLMKLKKYAQQIYSPRLHLKLDCHSYICTAPWSNNLIKTSSSSFSSYSWQIIGKVRKLKSSELSDWGCFPIPLAICHMWSERDLLQKFYRWIVWCQKPTKI